MPTLSRFIQLKTDFAKELKTLSAMLTSEQRLQAALKAKTSAVSFARYTKGDIDELRNMELAESLIDIMKKIK